MSDELMEYKVLNAEIVRETFKELGGKQGFFIILWTLRAGNQF